MKQVICDLCGKPIKPRDTKAKLVLECGRIGNPHIDVHVNCGLQCLNGPPEPEQVDES